MGMEGGGIGSEHSERKTFRVPLNETAPSMDVILIGLAFID